MLSVCPVSPVMFGIFTKPLPWQSYCCRQGLFVCLSFGPEVWYPLSHYLHCVTVLNKDDKTVNLHPNFKSEQCPSVCPKFLYSATSATRVIIFLLYESSNRVDIRLHTENQLLRYSGSGLNVFVLWIYFTLSLQFELCWVELGCNLLANLFILILQLAV